MSLADVVNCAPWRLSAPRALTPYEWGVVQTALGRAMDEVAFGLGRTSEPRQLVLAMQAQPCTDWKTSKFGPAPSVALYWYRCFARWYAGLDMASRARARVDVATGMLCSASQPWSNCSTGRGTGPADLWEGGAQIVEPSLGMPSTEPCAYYRDRTMYIPARGRDLVKMLQFLGPAGQLPPGLVDMAAAAPALFLDRDFVLGLQAKKNPPWASLATSADMAGLALATMDELALIWAPGQGASLLEFLRGPIDPQKLLALFAQMSPGLGGLLSIPGLPGLLQTYGPGLGDLWKTAGQMIPQLLGTSPMHGLGATAGTVSPGTKPTTGLPLIDLPRAELAGRIDMPPPPLPAGTPTVGVGDDDSPIYVVGGIVAAVGLALLLTAAYRRRP